MNKLHTIRTNLLNIGKLYKLKPIYVLDKFPIKEQKFYLHIKNKTIPLLNNGILDLRSYGSFVGKLNKLCIENNYTELQNRDINFAYSEYIYELNHIRSELIDEFYLINLQKELLNTEVLVKIAKFKIDKEKSIL
jgi:hypothetical protein